jgi:thioredoxin-related protein
MCLFVEKTFAEEVIINDIAIAQQEAKETNTKLLLVFTADWCKYCTYLKNDLMANIDTVNEKYTVCFIDFDSNPELARKYKVTSIPVSVAFDEDVYYKKVGYGRNFLSYMGFLKL